jgi:IS5 family transposase
MTSGSGPPSCRHSSYSWTQDRGRGHVEWNIARPPGSRRELADDSPRSRIERIKASVRAKVEHPFRYVKRVFGYEKVRYRGLAKNENRLALLLGFANLMRAERYLEGA